ncbi:ATP-dependent nuclease subunit B [Streptococcus ovuberis]|uniref:ATP-dependent nuclease subunit B n=1 Tax=Streptococcus ovuberis TaxID=1936207 RepID=A0A7X6MX42_9STRE|nr:ATP-dependent nuclease subunit B [Streptococcus ovuberis]NKZ19328.1 ATP-dependent nuclease subunit B [Streptococcus ovuberis]
MKLIYTDIHQDLTAILTKEALSLSADGRRVFYIAPNSLSFEKERQVLTYLPEGASFDILVTRFSQMVRYVTLNGLKQQKTLDDTGLVMLFYRALANLPENSLKVYGQLSQSIDFLQQLVELHKELQSAGMSAADLTELDAPEKAEDLQTIFQAFYQLFNQQDYQEESKVSFLIRQIQSGELGDDLKRIALVIDGFTRFSIEEENLVKALEAAGVPVVIGTYASQKAYKASQSSGGLYQAGVDFLRDLAQIFAVKPDYVISEEVSTNPRLMELSQQFQSCYDFTLLENSLSNEAKETVSLWEVISLKEEVVHVAKQIRAALEKGYRYKDILVLLGDVDSYRLHIGKLFDQYEIPYYFGRAEAMSQHPLVNVIDSLWRLKRYHYQAEDLVNLLKTGLYGQARQDEIDRLEHYIHYAQLKGASQFGKPFRINPKGKYDLERLNELKESLIDPVLTLLQARPQTGQAFLEQLNLFLETGRVSNNLAEMAQEAGSQALEEAEQVWQVFSNSLVQFYEIFGDQILKVEEALSLIRAGLLGAHFRAVPATVDVVTVKSYDLITPAANRLVFAIGLTQRHFPKLSKNSSLLSDEERLRINEKVGRRLLDISSQEQGKRNHFTALSLLHSATDHLVLSYPQLFNETDEVISPYLSQLEALGLPKIIKGRASFDMDLADIGNYKGLLSQVIELNRQDLPEVVTEAQETFWAVAVRYLRQKLAKEGLSLPQISPSLETQPLKKETLDYLYPKNQPLRLSASSLTDYYNSQYKYFLKHVLGLQEIETILPDARIHGTFLHQVFEEILRDQSPVDFDTKVSRALEKTGREEVFRQVYEVSAETAFTHEMLEDIARSTARVLRDDHLVDTIAEEAGFEARLAGSGEQPISLVGKIDRIDRLKASETIGVIDYKSSAQTFQLGRFFNGLSPQLMTYLLAMTKQDKAVSLDQIFGAVYLHMTDPVVDLQNVKTLEELPKLRRDLLQFKGLFVEEASQGLTSQYGKTSANTYSQNELDLLLRFTDWLYSRAAKGIATGHFAINPYSEDGRSVAGDQYNSITHFEADLHLGQARKLAKLGRKKEDWLDKISQILE